MLKRAINKDLKMCHHQKREMSGNRGKKNSETALII